MGLNAARISGRSANLHDAEASDDDKPDDEDRTEHNADTRRALELNGEQCGQKPNGDRDDDIAQSRRRNLQSLDGGDDADRRRYHPVAEKQSRSEHERPQERRRAALFVFVQQTIEREQAAFAVILRAQDQDRVLDGDNDGDRPDHQRNAAQHLVRRLRRASSAEE